MTNEEEYLLDKIDVIISNQIKTRSRNAKVKSSNILDFSNANNLGSNTHS